jgi:hypothetical protein
MGCWNGTCAVTRLPIFAGDPVVGFLLEHKSIAAGGGFSESDAMWTPLATHFFGKYDDYGGIADIEMPDWARAIAEKCVQGRSWPMPGDGRDPAVVPAELCVDNGLLRQIFGGRIALKRGTGRIPVGYMMAHRFAFDVLAARPLDYVRRSKFDHWQQIAPFWFEDRRLYMHAANAADQAARDYLYEFFAFSAGMESIRVAWSPQPGAGGHTVDYRAHRAMNEMARAWMDMNFSEEGP